MLVATFGPTTGWTGKTITQDGDSFVLEGQGEIRATDVVCYWQQGHIAWASYEACSCTVDRAKNAVSRESRDSERQMKGLDKASARAESHGRGHVAALDTSGGKVVLYEDRIETPQGSSWLSPAVNATVDTAGNLTVERRATLTRVAAGGLLLGPFGMLAGGMLKKKAKDDGRELYLLIETPDFVGLFPCDPKRGAAVRQFTARIRTAVLRQPQLEQERAALVAAAQEASSAAQAGAAQLQQARSALEAAGEALRLSAPVGALG